MNKRANAVGIGIIVSILLLCVFAPFISNMISNADNIYECQDTTYPVISRNQLLCTNVSYACLNALLPIYVAPNLCTNTSGVGVVNATATSGFLVYNETSTDVGMSGAESTILRLTIIFLVLGLFAVLLSPLLKKK